MVNEVRICGLKHQKEKRSMAYFAGLDVSVKETSVCSFSCGTLSIPQIGTFLRILLLLRLGLRDLRDQLLADGVAEGIEVLRDRDERAGAADDIVAIVVCKPAGWVGVAGIGVGLRLGQDDQPVDRDALGDRHIPRRSRLAAGIVVAIPRKMEEARVGIVGSS